MGTMGDESTPEWTGPGELQQARPLPPGLLVRLGRPAPAPARPQARAQRATVSRVRVVIAVPKARSMSCMNTGPLGVGT